MHDLFNETNFLVFTFGCNICKIARLRISIKCYRMIFLIFCSVFENKARKTWKRETKLSLLFSHY